jgi:hypothetical protein
MRDGLFPMSQIVLKPAHFGLMVHKRKPGLSPQEKNMTREGLEPSTRRLRVCCSAS